MIEIIIAIGLSGQATYSLINKSLYFFHSFDSTLFLIATIVYIVIAFQKFEWYVPLLGIIIGGSIAAWLQFLIYSIIPDTSSLIKKSSIVEWIYSVTALILITNNFS